MYASGLTQHLSVVKCGVAARIWSVSHPMHQSRCVKVFNSTTIFHSSIMKLNNTDQTPTMMRYTHSLIQTLIEGDGPQGLRNRLPAVGIVPPSLLRFLHENGCPPLIRVTLIAIRELLTPQYFLLSTHISFGNQATWF